MKLPESSDNWYFDGYPRSGNTFNKGLLLHVHPELNGASHLHCIASLKIALRRQIRTVIIFRDPLQSIPSFAYTKSNRNKLTQEYNAKLLEELVLEWLSYYHFVLQKIDKGILLIEFNPSIAGLINNVQKVETYLGLNVIQDDKLQQMLFDFQEVFKNRENSKELAYSSLPKQERIDFKNKIKDDLFSLKLYKEATALYLQMQRIANKV